MTKLNLKPNELKFLRKLTNCQNTDKYFFLGFSLDLETAELIDLLCQNTGVSEAEAYVLTTLLAHYSCAEPTPLTRRLIKFRELPGGNAYEKAFTIRAIQPIESVFGENPLMLVKAAKILSGTAANFGDAAASIPALHGIPICYILWGAGEFAASATVLFDESASCYLPTEDLAVLGELATCRLKQVQESWKKE